MTPEGKIKSKINTLLDTYGDRIYKFMPVPTGYGKRTVDYLLCVLGQFAAIEAKKPGGKPTGKQADTLEAVVKAGGIAFVIDDDDGVDLLKRWLDLKMKQVPITKLPQGRAHGLEPTTIGDAIYRQHNAGFKK